VRGLGDSAWRGVDVERGERGAWEGAWDAAFGEAQGGWSGSGAMRDWEIAYRGAGAIKGGRWSRFGGTF
jgi:hypothetical protein